MEIPTNYVAVIEAIKAISLSRRQANNRLRRMDIEPVFFPGDRKAYITRLEAERAFYQPIRRAWLATMAEQTTSN